MGYGSFAGDNCGSADSTKNTLTTGDKMTTEKLYTVIAVLDSTGKVVKRKQRGLTAMDAMIAVAKQAPENGYFADSFQIVGAYAGLPIAFACPAGEGESTSYASDLAQLGE